MHWQRRYLNLALELDPATGLPWYREARLSVGRQAGKTFLILPTAIHRGLTFELMGWGRRPRTKLVLQNAQMARRKFLEDFWPIIDQAPKVRSRIRTLVKSSGREGLVFVNGARFEVGGNTRDANHSQTIASAWLDECFAYGPDGDEEQSVGPAMSTVSAGQIFMSSAAGDAESTWWHDKCDDGRARVDSGLDSRVCYVEYSIGDDDDPEDEALWPVYMPGLAEGLVDPDTIRGDLDRMGLAGFTRAYGNRRTLSRDHLIPPGRWAAIAGDVAPEVGEIVLSVDVSFDDPEDVNRPPRSTAISVAGWTASGLPLVEVIDHREGTEWAAARVAQLLADEPRIRRVALDSKGPVLTIRRELERVVPKRRLVWLSTTDVCAAALEFHQRAMDGRLRHRAQHVLDQAVAAAKKRHVVDAWCFGRKMSTGDITPLVSCSQALHVLLQREGILSEML
jgi:hypothetical protein